MPCCPCKTRMTLTLSACHAWGNPTLMLHSAGLIALTARVSVWLLCAQGSQREHSPVVFTQLDQRPSMAASDMISFSVSDNELDVSLSLAASDAEELLGSVADPALLPSSASCCARMKPDDELIRVMSKAVNELGLEWSPPEERSHRFCKVLQPGCPCGAGQSPFCLIAIFWVHFTNIVQAPSFAWAVHKLY